MKAIKFFFIILFSILILNACKPKNQAPNKLSQSTKDYFEIRNGGLFIFGTISDTSVSIPYTSGNYINNQVNPDIENNEIIMYELSSSGKPLFTIRSEAGGTQYKDRVAMLSKFNDTTSIAAIIFNLNGKYEPQPGTYDSVIQYPTYAIGNKTFNDVLRVKVSNNAKYKQVILAKNIGLISWQTKNDIIYYLKRYALK